VTRSHRCFEVSFGNSTDHRFLVGGFCRGPRVQGSNLSVRVAQRIGAVESIGWWPRPWTGDVMSWRAQRRRQDLDGNLTMDIDYAQNHPKNDLKLILISDWCIIIQPDSMFSLHIFGILRMKILTHWFRRGTWAAGSHCIGVQEVWHQWGWDH